jgi:hypothetical protein
LAARASSEATGGCSVSFNVAARRSKTVISLANPLALFYFRASCPCPSRALGREGAALVARRPVFLAAACAHTASDDVRAAQRLAARASGRATGACSVSFNVAVLLSRTVISPANLGLCFISGQASPRPSRALRREGEEAETVDEEAH